jgi:hypothetical protein
MNKILRIGGLPVKARHRRLDSWEISERVNGKQIVFSASRSTRGEESEIGQRVVRDAFLGIKTPADALKFFKKFGPFQRQGDSLSLQFKNRLHEENAPEVQFASVQILQLDFRKFIETPSPECFQSDINDSIFEKYHRFLLHAAPRPTFTVELGHVRYKDCKFPSPYLQQYSDDVFSAIYTSIYIEKMAGAGGAICGKCDKVFLFYSDKPALFCSRKCGNAARQAQVRARKKAPREVTNG